MNHATTDVDYPISEALPGRSRPAGRPVGQRDPSIARTASASRSAEPSSVSVSRWSSARAAERPHRMRHRSGSRWNRKTRARKSAGLLHSRLDGDLGRPQGRSPDHPGLPARVSLLMLPARGTVARLLAPRERPQCSPDPGPSWSRLCVRTLEPGSGVDPSCRGQPPVALNPTPFAQSRRLQSEARRYHPRRDRSLDVRTRALPFTGNAEATGCSQSDPLALLIGFALDQQVTVQKAFSGPWELQRRLGHLDARRIAGTDPAELDRVFRERPALHRFPGLDGRQGRGACAAIAERYDGDACRIWREAKDGRDLQARLLDLPGIGEMKARRSWRSSASASGVDLPGMAR